MVNFETLTRTYEIDPDRRHPLALFVRGESYRLWGIWEGEIHLFGTADGGRAYLLGTDRDGRDLLSRILLGARLSLSIGLVGVALSFCFGIVLGSGLGYFGGAVDMVIQRFIEVLTSIPTLPLWMGLSAALPLRWPVVKVFFFISLILSLLGWPELARVCAASSSLCARRTSSPRRCWTGGGDPRRDLPSHAAVVHEPHHRGPRRWRCRA